MFCKLPTETHDPTQPTKRQKISTEPNTIQSAGLPNLWKTLSLTFRFSLLSVLSKIMFLDSIVEIDSDAEKCQEEQEKLLISRDGTGSGFLTGDPTRPSR